MIRQKINIPYISYDEKDEEYIYKFINQTNGIPLGELVGLAMVNYIKTKENDKLVLNSISEQLGNLTDTVKETSEKTSKIVVESSRATREHMDNISTELKDAVDSKSVTVPVTELEYILTQYSKLTDEMKQIVLENKRYNKALASTVVKQQERVVSSLQEDDLEDLDDLDEIGDLEGLPAPPEVKGFLGKIESAKDEAKDFLKAFVIKN